MITDGVYEEFEHDGLCYDIEYVCEICLDSVDYTPGPAYGYREFSIETNVYSITTVDSDTGKRGRMVSETSALFSEIEKDFADKFEPEERDFEKAYEEAEEERYSF